MPREKGPPPKTDDVPAWFMTYSDVITLLMTFFILLMTFATNEPESFERMQISMFGGAGATGVAGDPEAMEYDAILVRERPRSSRTTMRGSETPPINEDPGINALGEGLAGLDGPQKFDPNKEYAVEIPLTEMFTSSGELAPTVRQLLFTAGQRIRKGALRATLRAAPNHLDGCLKVSNFLIESGSLHPSSVGVGALLDPSKADVIRFELLKTGQER
ncbi:MAG: flagellar motor protein MotB [Planctomycetales bacterium]|nr:flagellar motor protein MotB [Planctomycetales bacterium]